MKPYPLLTVFLVINILFYAACKKKEAATTTGIIQLAQVKAGPVVLKIGETTKDIEVDSSFTIYFNNTLDPSSVNGSILLKKADNTGISCDLVIFNNNRNIRLTPQKPLDHSTNL